jgi:hypothetical protein
LSQPGGSKEEPKVNSRLAENSNYCTQRTVQPLIPEAVPPSVRALDAWLLERVRHAKTDAELDGWLRVVLREKRRIASVPSAAVDAAASATLARLQHKSKVSQGRPRTIRQRHRAAPREWRGRIATGGCR